ncbi:MAG TPA: hypothetical protein VMD27_09720 [Candidatus Aquilonibacter sp.]|nr:hypothetical protein [Candidatus Aquilonibacter sp.]
MPIGPVSDSHREISVVEPVSPALEHVKRMLFKPFDLGKWFVIGFCAWLARLGESGGSNFNFGGNNFNNQTSGSSGESLRHGFEEAKDYVLNNLYWIIPVAALLIIFCFALGFLVMWLNSRGKFMFLHCVALNKADVAEPWRKFATEANSLFWFRFVLSLVGMALSLPLLIVIAVLIVQMVLRGEPDAAAIMLAVMLAMLFFLLVIIFALIQKFTADFVVPILFLRGGKCLNAWNEFWTLLCANAGKFTLYILFQIVLGMAIGVIVVLAILLTCCIAGCLMIIPYIGTVLLLPVFVFQRSYSLYFLRQFGPAYDVFPPVVPPAPPAGLQPLPGTQL